jgi:hypothetical protein
MPLDLSVVQQSVLSLDVSVLQQSVLCCACVATEALRCPLPNHAPSVYVEEEHVLHMDVSVYKSQWCTCTLLSSVYDSTSYAMQLDVSVYKKSLDITSKSLFCMYFLGLYLCKSLCCTWRCTRSVFKRLFRFVSICRLSMQARNTESNRKRKLHETTVIQQSYFK